MAFLFDISQSGNSSLQVKPKQPVDMAFQVKNVSGRRIHTRIYMKETTDAAKSAWTSFKGKKELLVDIEPGVVQAVTVTMTVPQGAAAGKSTFYLYAQDTDQPDEGDKSPAMSVEVLPGAAPTMPGWVIPVIAIVALIVVGVGGWLVYKHIKPPDVTVSTTKVQVPSVTGMKLGDAQAILGYQKFTNVQLLPNLSGGTVTPGMVYGQDPAPNTEVALTDAISLRFVPTSVTVPGGLLNKDLGSALAILQTAGLQFGGVCCPANANAPQLVLWTSPGLNTSTDVGHKVILYTTNPQTATVGPVPTPVYNGKFTVFNLQKTMGYQNTIAASIKK